MVGVGSVVAVEPPAVRDGRVADTAGAMVVVVVVVVTGGAVAGAAGTLVSLAAEAPEYECAAALDSTAVSATPPSRPAAVIWLARRNLRSRRWVWSTLMRPSS